jgi:hypothetical protein
MFCGGCHPSPVGFTESAFSDVGVPGEAEKEWNMCASCSEQLHRESQVTTLWLDRGLQEQEKCSLFGHTMRPRYGQGMAPGVCVPEASDRRLCGEVSTNRLCGRR